MSYTTQQLIDEITKSTKKTPVKIWLKGEFQRSDFIGFDVYQGVDFWVIFAQWSSIEPWMQQNQSRIESIHIEADRRNSAIPLLDILTLQARIEPGVYIREMVHIGKQVVVMMGAVINIGASIGDQTMIDMNAVIGGRAEIGSHCHIGAGAVIAGVIEPISATPVVIGNHVLVGANAVILEGITVGEHSVIAAGAVVTKNVPPYCVAAGMPAKVIKKIDDKTRSKTGIEVSLRDLDQ
jgi:tetrahydrodipicolinate N-acetyltransferase